MLLPVKGKRSKLEHQRRLFPFRKRPLLFLTDDTATGNQAFSHRRRNMFPGLSYHKAKNTVLNSLKKNDVEAQVVEFMFKVMGRARVTCY